MSWLDNLRELNEVNLADLDLENVGSWPAAARGLLIVLLFIALLAGGYYYHLSALSGRLQVAKEQELELRRQFERKSFEAQNLDAYTAQLTDMRQSLGA